MKEHTRQDSTLQTVMTALRNNSWSSVLASPDPSTNSNDLQAFYKIRDALSVSDNQDLLLRSHRLVLLVTLCSRALHIAHEGHQGLTKTKQLLREKIWFPGTDAMTKQLLDNCIACQASACSKLPGNTSLLISVDLFPQVICYSSSLMNTLVIRKSKLSVLPPRIPSSQSSIASYLHTEILPKLKQTTVLHSKVTHSPSFRSTWVSTTVKSPLLGLKLIRSQNVLCEHSTKPYVPPSWKIKIGNKNCSIFCATIVPHLIPLPEFPLLSFFLDVNSS